MIFTKWGEGALNRNHHHSSVGRGGGYLAATVIKRKIRVYKLLM